MKEINMTKAISCMPDKFITMEMVELAAAEHNFFGGSLIKLVGSDVPSVALTTTSNYFRTTLPGAETLSLIHI